MRRLVQVGAGLVHLVRVFPVEPFAAQGDREHRAGVVVGVDAEARLHAGAVDPQVLVEVDVQQLDGRAVRQADPGQVVLQQQDGLAGVVTGDHWGVLHGGEYLQGGGGQIGHGISPVLLLCRDIEGERRRGATAERPCPQRLTGWLA
ncbi:hypothetical protein D3C77_624250 [compost metagenome]